MDFSHLQAFARHRRQTRYCPVWKWRHSSCACLARALTFRRQRVRRPRPRRRVRQLPRRQARRRVRQQAPVPQPLHQQRRPRQLLRRQHPQRQRQVRQYPRLALRRLRRLPRLLLRIVVCRCLVRATALVCSSTMVAFGAYLPTRGRVCASRATAAGRCGCSSVQ